MGSFNFPTAGSLEITNTGDQFFAENTSVGQSSTTLPTAGTPPEPGPGPVPEPATYIVFAIFGLFGVFKWRNR